MAASLQHVPRRALPIYNRCLCGITVSTKRHIGVKKQTIPLEVGIDIKGVESLNPEIVKKRNPGAHAKNKLVFLPEDLDNALNSLISRYGHKGAIEDAKKLNRYLVMRQTRVEDEHIQVRAMQIAKEMNYDIEETDKTTEEELTEEDQRKLETIRRRLRKEFYHWKPLKLNSKSAMTYMIARLGQNYSVIHRVLEEIRIRDPDYTPLTVYNYGSGTCSAVWAIHNAWDQQKKRTTHEYYCEDPSPQINNLAKLLFQDGYENNKMKIKGVFIRDKPPFDQNPFHLVVSAYSLLEQASQLDRINMVQSLWDRTKDYLVLIDVGNFAGHHAIQEAKDYLLHATSEQPEEERAHVFSPCPHEKICPKFGILDGRVACTFGVRHSYLQVYHIKGKEREEKYSFVIMKKGPVRGKDLKWPRVVQRTILGHNHVHCHLCCDDGNFRHFTMSKAKTHRELYKVGRNVRWGDRLPVDLAEVYDKESLDRQSESDVGETEEQTQDGVELPNVLTKPPLVLDVIDESDLSDSELMNDEILDEDTEDIDSSSPSAGESESQKDIDSRIDKILSKNMKSKS